MERLVIEGGKRLRGEVTISGAKNSVVAIIAGSVLVNGTCVIEGIPNIKDVALILDIIEKIGAKVSGRSGTISIDCSEIHSYCADDASVRKMRASYYLLGSLLGRFHNAQVALPGGCNFGTRPIDQHLKSFRALGAKVEIKAGMVETSADQLKGGNIYMDVVSVGATVNAMLAACLAKGTTVIENAAKEPHIVDLANFLNAMGANIKGAGTDTIRVFGVPEMRGGRYTTIPDQIEAGTFMIAAAAMGDDVLVKNVIPKHMDSLTAKLIEMGVTITEYDDAIRVQNTGRLTATNVKTMPYPGFPTDLQPQMVTLLCTAEGMSNVTEGVWDNRFQYVEELIRMGADIQVQGRNAIVNGVAGLCGAPVKATDLRAGAGMVIAGLMAEGTTEISHISHIDRGYENLEEKLRGLGANVERIFVSGDEV